MIFITMSKNFLTLQDVYMARQRISSIVRRTPLVESSGLSTVTGSDVRLKLENLQITGAFKLRGAANKIKSLSEEELARGVITVSSGNHGKAVSYVAGMLGVKATICVPETVPENKRQAIEALGTELVVVGENADRAMEYADELQAERGLTMVHPFDDLAIIAGQGTIGLELQEEIPEIDTVLVPLSGGGLMSGIAFAVKAIRPSIHVVGITMEQGAAMVESLAAGRVVDIIEEPTLADALAGGLNKDNKYTYPMVKQYVDETVLVSEEEIAEAMYFCLEEHHIILEGGAAVGVAALLSKKVKKLGKTIAVVLSGGNVSMEVLKKIINQGENRK
jgi:threonine dehydratase